MLARTPAQVAAARRNGARSRGPATPEGKARSRLNALKHGMRAERLPVLAGEDMEGADAFFARVRADIAPSGEVELGVAEAVAAAWWRAQRADRLEAALLNAAHVWGERDGENSAGARLARDPGALRALGGIVRYRAQAEAEARRGLGLLSRLRREGLVGGGADGPDVSAPNEPGNPGAAWAANANEPGDLVTNEPERPALRPADPDQGEPEAPVAATLDPAPSRGVTVVARGATGGPSPPLSPRGSSAGSRVAATEAAEANEPGPRPPLNRQQRRRLAALRRRAAAA
jgi:hypothetical protein